MVKSKALPFGIRLILLSKAGMLDYAYKVFDELPQFNCSSTVNALNALLSACVKSKNFDSTAYQLHRQGRFPGPR